MSILPVTSINRHPEVLPTKRNTDLKWAKQMKIMI